MAGLTKNAGVRRRDFLAGASAGALLAGLPWLPKAAIAATQAQRAPMGARVARVRIYPALGICRVGGGQRFFLSPEVPGLPPRADGGFKDGDSSLKKQAQRFRVYAFDSQDRVIGELTGDDAKIAWRVRLANTKAAWYGFINPLDNGKLAPGVPGLKRNAFIVSDAERENMLVIDGGERTISGPSINANGGDGDYRFVGRFWRTEQVALGELRTDDSGRLLVIPPDGISRSPTHAGITSFADNDDWYDDWCDGPVDAAVTLADGRVLEAEPSWVACVGPDYAPGIPAITTLYDVIQNLNVEQQWATPPTRPLSFRKYVYPTFRRVALMQWLTNAARLRQGWLNVGAFSDEKFIAKLADPSDGNKTFRKSILALFRNPDDLGPNAFKDERLKIPYMMGDGVNYDGSPLQWFQFPKLQYSYLESWAAGDFVNDLDDPATDAVVELKDMPVELQPDALTEAALEACSGGAFHPGVELSYYMRLAPMYSRSYDAKAEPFRIARGARPSLIQDVGHLLTAEAAFKGSKDVPPPIGRQMRGDLTRWMGLPWQCDAFSCQQVMMQTNFPTAVWWPALLPVDVLPSSYYRELMRTNLPAAERVKFFNSRVAWARGVPGLGYHPDDGYWRGITNMIALWERMGFVVRRPGPTDAGRPKVIPDELYVEVDRADTMEKRFDWKPADGMLP